ncbi:MAG: hypothetical protein V4708_17565 [Bacteroidota bacterium]
MTEPFRISKEDSERAKRGGLNLKDYTERILNAPRQVPGIVLGHPSTYTSPAVFMEGTSETNVANHLRNSVNNRMYNSVPIDKKERSGYIVIPPYLTQPSTIGMPGGYLTDYDKRQIYSQVHVGVVVDEVTKRFDSYRERLQSAARANEEIKKLFTTKKQIYGRDYPYTKGNRIPKGEEPI